jgi:hypothetical protein
MVPKSLFDVFLERVGCALITGDYSFLADQNFLERRRRSLQRYLTHLVHHPIFQCDPYVKVFLSRSEEITTYRKSVDVDSTPEELRTSEPLSPELDEYLQYLSPQLESIFNGYQRLVHHLETIADKMRDSAHELNQMSLTLK